MEEEKQKTAVEFLYKIIHAHIHIDKDLSEYLEQAKEMFEEQIKDAYLNGRYDADKIVMTERFYAEQYYNETFKQQ